MFQRVRSLGRAKRGMRSPAQIQAHDWSPEAIRADPDAAFDLFDANHDNVISVAELLFTTRKTNESVRRRGSIFDEMKLFQLLDVDGNSVISREEFCQVVKDPHAFSDEALAAIAQLATKREMMKRAEEEAMLVTEEKQEEAPEDDEALSNNVAATAMALARSLSRRNSERSETESPVKPWEPEDSDDVLLELFAVGLAAVDHEWYDVFGLFKPSRADPYVVIAADRGGRRCELATTEVRTHTLNTGWRPVHIDSKTLRSLDEPFKVRAELYDAHTHSRIGETVRFAITRASDTAETAIGPLAVYDAQDNLAGKILGTMQWINHKTWQARHQVRDKFRASDITAPYNNCLSCIASMNVCVDHNIYSGDRPPAAKKKDPPFFL